MRARRSLIAVFASLAVGSTADAATITLSSDKLFAYPGETFTVIVTATLDGTETDDGITGVLLFNTALVDPTAGGATQTPLTSLGGTATWTQGALGAFCTNASGSCRMFSQVSPIGPQTVSSPASPFVLATKSFVMGAFVGSATFSWLISPASPVAQRLDFFGVTSAPSLSVPTDPIPEPSTAALLGLGLLGLAAVRRMPRR